MGTIHPEIHEDSEMCSAFRDLGIARIFARCERDVDAYEYHKSNPESAAHILEVARTVLGEPNLISLLRLEDLNLAPTGSPFTVSYPQSNTADISWNLSGTGFELSGVYIFGGSNGANLYKVTDAEQMISGSATIHPPVTGNSQQFAAISHTLFLGVAVPEPSSAMLLMFAGASFLACRLRRR
jgi:hypothetical protein